MKQYKMLVREFLSEYTCTLRNNLRLTQDEMAEQLRITSRAYGDLERGKYCFAAVTLLFLLLMLSDEDLKIFLEGFRKKAYDFEHKEAA